MLARGAWLYVEYCARCHNVPGDLHSGNYPNLGAMSQSTHKLFNQIVLEGLFNYGGMAAFDDQLSVEDNDAIHQYLIEAQRAAWGDQQKSRAL